MNHLTDTQHAAVVSDDPLIIVVASPGSGKTETLICRIKRLIVAGVRPERMVAITFTNAAARVIERRLGDGEPVKLGYAGTLHSFMLRQIQNSGFMPAATVIDAEQAAAIREQVSIDHRWKGSVKVVDEAIATGPAEISDGTTLDLIRMDYYQRLKRGQMLDFDSILFYGLQAIRGREQEFDYLYVDELQDSSELDVAIYNALKIRNKFYVGDVDQSIYGWRGGNPRIMMRMLESPNGTKFVLDKNFRSDRAICAVADQLIAHNTTRFPKLNIPVHEANPGLVEALTFLNPAVELAFVAGDIARTVSAERYHETAILTRTNALAEEFANALEWNCLPVARVVKRQLPAGWRLCRALLNFLSNPDNNELAYEYVRLANGTKRANELKLLSLSQYKTINALEFKFPIRIKVLNLIEHIASRACKDMIDGESIQFLMEAIYHLHDPDATIAELLESLVEDTTEVRGHGITVSTIHAAKGREFDTVYLPAWEQGIIPSGQADVEEERRLAFVAITRARHRVVITHCQSRQRKWERDTTATPSQFIKEIGKANATAGREYDDREEMWDDA